MAEPMDRRAFIRGSLGISAAAAVGSSLSPRAMAQAAPPAANGATPAAPGLAGGAQGASDAMPQGRIEGLRISRLLLGGNLLTHYTHSRDLKYVYALTAHYNTEAKILQTLAVAEQHGVNALVIHTVPAALNTLKKHRKAGGKIQWIICPTAPIEPNMQAYCDQVRQLVDDGTEAIYLWGVHADALVAAGKTDLLAKAVEAVKAHPVPSGVGAHDLRVVVECLKNKVPADFFIKTFHHHRYPSAPRPDQLQGPYNEVPGYWCRDPEATADLMRTVEKPWIAFKVMAAGAIPPQDAFRYAFENGADHVLAGMFDFEIAEDAAIARKAIAEVKRTRPWRS